MSENLFKLPVKEEQPLPEEDEAIRSIIAGVITRYGTAVLSAPWVLTAIGAEGMKRLQGLRKEAEFQAVPNDDKALEEITTALTPHAEVPLQELEDEQLIPPSKLLTSSRQRVGIAGSIPPKDFLIVTE